MQNYYNNPYYVNYNNAGVVKMPSNQPLTEEEIKSMRNQANTMNYSISPMDALRGICTHKDQNGDTAVVFNADGTCQCTICNHKWKMFEGTRVDVQTAVDNILDIVQCIKLMYPELPEEIIRKFLGPIIPMLEKLPDMWDFTIKSFARFEDMSNPVNRVTVGGYNSNPFNQFSNMMINGGMGMGAMPGYAPGFGYQAQQFAQPGMPQYAVQQQAIPQYNPGMGYQGMPVVQQPAQQFAQPGAVQQPGQYTQQFMPDMTNPMAYAPAVGVMPNGAVPVAATPVNTAPTPAPAAPAAPAPASGEVIQQQKVYTI